MKRFSEKLKTSATRHVIVAISTLAAVIVSAPQAHAAGETIEVVITQTDGTPSFDTAAGAGLDTGDSNGVVRTNDLLEYGVNVNVIDPLGGTVSADNTVISVSLPQGVEVDLNSLVASCAAGYTVTPNSPMANPALPITMTSYLSLPRQQLTCRVGNQASGTSVTYPFSARVRGEVPNGTSVNLAAADVKVTSDFVTTPVSPTAGVDATVSARAKVDVDKTDAGTNYQSYQNARPCATPGNPDLNCFRNVPTINISIPSGGKGSTPLQQTFTFTDDVSPATYITGWAALSTTVQNEILADPNKYGVQFESCSATPVYYQPDASGGTSTSVTQSGTLTCSQPGGPGTPIQMTYTGADTTGNHCPEQAARPAGFVLPADKCYIAVGRILIRTPYELVLKAGIESPADVFVMGTNNTYTNFAPLGIDGVVNTPGADSIPNNSLSSSLRITPSGSFDKFYVGVPNEAANTPAVQCRPGNAYMDCPTGQTSLKSGDGTLLPSQVVLSNLAFRNSSTGSDTPRTFLACDSWDPTKFELAPGDYGPATNGTYYRIPSNGAAVWGAVYYPYAVGVQSTLPPGVVKSIEYGQGSFGSGVDSECDDADSTSGWSTTLDPSANKVRVLVELPIVDLAGSSLDVAIALRAKPNPIGTILPNFAAVKQFTGSADLATMLDSSRTWTQSTYNPLVAGGNFSGTMGDRIKIGSAYVRIKKEDKGPGASSFSASPGPTVTQGQQVEFRLTPTLNAGVDVNLTQPVIVEDCLPEGTTLANSTPAPTYSGPQSGGPANLSGVALPDLTCGSGEQYVVWDLGQHRINRAITPIVYKVNVSLTSSTGTKINTARVITTDDASSGAQRTATNQLTVQALSGFKISKVALTPLNDVNRVGETNPDPLRWEVEVALVTPSPLAISDLDLIDVLPFNNSISATYGQGSTPATGGATPNATDFDGTLKFVRAYGIVDNADPAGGPEQILFTSAAPESIDTDPTDPTNAAAGATVWCSAADSTGTVVIGNAGGACPTSPDQVTGLRVLRSGALFPSTANSFKFRVEMLPEGNTKGDVYENVTGAKVNGIALPVGPVLAPEYVVSGSIGDRVFHDLNADGVQSLGEVGIGGVSVALSGTDSDGNPVSASTVTDPTGLYLFPNLPAGTYRVQFDYSTATVPLPAGTRYTQADLGSDDTTDSDALGTGVNVPVAQTALINLPIEFNNHDVDAGVWSPAALGDRIWEDMNANGQQDAGEPGIEGATVALWVDADGDPATIDWMLATEDADGAAITPVVTGPSGAYSFTNLKPALYQVRVGLPTGEGFVFTGQDVGNDASDSDVDPATGNSAGVRLQSNETNNTIDAGAYRPVSVGDRVWLDLDADGVQDPGESGIGGVLVELLDGGGAVVGSVLTDANGVWKIDRAGPSQTDPSATLLAPATYTVRFTRPDGLTPSSTSGAPETGASDSDGVFATSTSGTGTTQPFTLVSNTVENDIDQGFFPTFKLGNRVWTDVDGDGVFTAGTDQVASGVVVELLNSAGDVVASEMTDATGLYLFGDGIGSNDSSPLLAGEYRVRIPASQFAAGGPLVDYVAETAGFASDPDLDVDENRDHNGAAALGGEKVGGVVTNPITLSANVDTATGVVTGNEPTGNGYENLTLDLALRGPAAIKIVKEVCDPAVGGGSCDPAAALGAAGWNDDSYAASINEDISWRITVTNTGRQTLTNVAVVDELETACSTPAAFTPPAVFNPGESFTYTCVTVKLAKGFVNVAAVTATTPSGGTVKDDDPAAVTRPDDPTPDLALVKSSTATSVAPGSEVPFTLTITNKGPGLAKDAVVRDTLPVGMAPVALPANAVYDDATRVISWPARDIAAGRDGDALVYGHDRCDHRHKAGQYRRGAEYLDRRPGEEQFR
jgi:uncharacterized repeat protein (TIGR01451 family)